MALHLTKHELGGLIDRATTLRRARASIRKGELWWQLMVVRPRRMAWPELPSQANFRMVVGSGSGQRGLVQLCVSPVHETMTSLDVQAL